MKFSTKLTLLFSVIGFIVGTSFTYFVYSSNIGTLEERITEELQSQAVDTIDKIDRMLFERYGNIKMLASDPVISARGSSPKQITERLTVYQNTVKIYDSLSFFDLNRVRIADTAGIDVGKQHSLTGYWPGVKEGKENLMNISESESLKKPEIHFFSIVKDKNGRPFGVVVSRIPLQGLYDIVRQVPVATNVIDEESLKINLIDRNGQIIFSNQTHEQPFVDPADEWDTIKIMGEKGKTVGWLKHFDLNYAREEILIFATEKGFQDFKGNNWTLMIDVPTRIAFAPAVELRNKIIFIYLLCSIFAIIIVFLISRKISNTIEALSIASEEISKGNLDVNVESRTKDETGRLAETFNKMVVDLKEQRSSLLSNKLELEKTVAEQTAELRTANKNLDRKAGELLMLYNITKSIHAILDLDLLLNNILDLISTKLGYSSTAIFLISETDGRLMAMATKGFPEKLGDISYDIGEGPVGFVAKEKRPIIVPDISSDISFPFFECKKRDVSSLIATPISNRDIIIGVLCATDPLINVFSENDERILAIVADQVAIAVENAKLFGETKRLAVTDGLTGLYTVRAFYEALHSEIIRATRYKESFSLLMMDVDLFKSHNDDFGHPSGDEVLKIIAHIIKKNCRLSDVIARYGGEEFAVLLINLNKAEALRIAERIRMDIELQEFTGNANEPMVNKTISIGLAEFADDATDNGPYLVKKADEALYRAKKSGRNRICVYS